MVLIVKATNRPTGLFDSSRRQWVVYAGNKMTLDENLTSTSAI